VIEAKGFADIMELRSERIFGAQHFCYYGAFGASHSCTENRHCPFEE